MSNNDQKRAKIELINAYGGSLTIADFASHTGLSRPEIDTMIQSNSLLCLIDDSGVRRIPTWQVYKNEILDGVSEVLAALGTRSMWSKQMFFITFSDYLEGELAEQIGSNDINPIMALQLGYKAVVLKKIENQG